jgi:holo-[acyl-carrier protein] synthase
VVIIGHGIDAVDMAEFATLLEQMGDHLTNPCFTGQERADSGSGPNRALRLAARFAAKEAALKALGVGWANGIAWTDVEIVSLPTGAPTLVLHSKAAEIAREIGVTQWLVTLTHTTNCAIASVIAIGER